MSKRHGISVEIPQAGETSSPSLHSAVAKQDLTAVRKVLAHDNAIPLEARDAFQRTPLVVAAKRGDATILSYLLAKGADPTVEASFGVTPGGWAAHNAHFADSIKEAFVGHPLSWAIRNNHFQTARILLSHPTTHEPFADADASRAATDVFGETVVHACVRAGNARLLNMVLAFGTWDATATNAAGQTPLEIAQSEALRRIFSQAALWTAPAPVPASVHAALADNSFPGIRAAVDAYGLAGLNGPGALNDAGETPLFAAAKAGLGTIVAYLLFRGADPTIKDKLGNSPLHVAAFYDHFETVRILLSHARVHAAFTGDDGDAYRKTVNGETVLHMAARSDNADLVRLVLAFETFTTELTATNNQGQAAKDVVTQLDVRTVLKSAAAAADAGAIELPLASPVPMTPRVDSRICAVCLCPPEQSVSKVLFTCSCLAVICDRCLGQTVFDGVSNPDSDGFPRCINTLCARRIPLHVVSDRLPASRQLELIAVVVNETVRKASADEKPAIQTCRVCSRDNDLSPVLASDSPAYACSHCGVRLCAVCNNIFPQSSVDSEIHAACDDRFPYVARFGQLQDIIAAASFRACPQCAVAPHAQPGALAPTAAVIACSGSCGDGVTYCALCGAARSADSDACTEACTAVSAAAANAGIADLVETAALLRARIAILDLAADMGRAHFVEMVNRFKWHDSLNTAYFHGLFPFTDEHAGFADDALPQWLAFEPAALWPFWAAAAPAVLGVAAPEPASITPLDNDNESEAPATADSQ